MSKEKVPKPRDTSKIRELLKLDASVVADIKLYDYLLKLKSNPEIAQSAAATLVNAIESNGHVDLDKQNPYRAAFLKMLRRNGVPAYKAFDKARGMQRTVEEIMDFLRAAAKNGFQSRMLILLVGPPGCGKGHLVNMIKDALEGQIVWVVKGCPVNESPLGLLNLLPEETIEALAEELQLIDDQGNNKLKEMLAVTGKPCQSCWRTVMENGGRKPIGLGVDVRDNKPNLDAIDVQAIRLSSRKFGISTWTPNDRGQGVSLQHVLAKGNRGLADMPEMLSTGQSLSQVELLIEVTNDRAMPAGFISQEMTGFVPLDVVLFGQTNEGALEVFLDKLQDPGKYTSRFFIKQIPYNVSVSEEEQAYKDELGRMTEVPHLDPMALKLLGLLAVTSRLDRSNSSQISISERARILDGEPLLIKRQITQPSPYSSNKPQAKSNSSKPPGEYWTVPELWETFPTDGHSGLSFRRMFTVLSYVVQDALSRGEKCLPIMGDHGLFSLTAEKLNELRSNLDYDEKLIFNQAIADLKTQAFGSKQDPGLIEQEYRRVLYRQVMEACAPDFVKRANELSDKYRLNCVALSDPRGKTWDDERQRDIEADIPFMEELERFIQFASQTEVDAFRRSIEVKIMQARREHREIHGKDVEFIVDWQTIPELAQGIKAKLVDEVSQKISRLVKSDLHLTDEEIALKAAALDRFASFGYCKHCMKEALTYFEAFELWNMAAQ